MIKLIVDECVGSRVSKWLNDNGYDAISIYDELRGADDNKVLQRALIENRILITSDKDFGDMVFRLQKDHCGVILLRLVDERSGNKIKVLQEI